MHMHLRGDQWKPRMHKALSTHWTGGAQTCCVQTPPGGVQIPQLSLQQTSPFWQALEPHGTVVAGHCTAQRRRQTCPGLQFVHTVRQPALRAARDMRVPAISAEPVSVPHARPWVANTTNVAANNVRAFTLPASAVFCRFLIRYWRI
jgi:hypothetical protein